MSLLVKDWKMSFALITARSWIVGKGRGRWDFFLFIFLFAHIKHTLWSLWDYLDTSIRFIFRIACTRTLRLRLRILQFGARKIWPLLLFNEVVKHLVLALFVAARKQIEVMLGWSQRWKRRLLFNNSNYVRTQSLVIIFRSLSLHIVDLCWDLTI